MKKVLFATTSWRKAKHPALTIKGTNAPLDLIDAIAATTQTLVEADSDLTTLPMYEGNSTRTRIACDWSDARRD